MDVSATYIKMHMYEDDDLLVFISLQWLHIKTTTTSTTILHSQDFVWDNMGEPVAEETFTHSHLSWSSIIPYLLPPSFTIDDCT